MRSYLALTGLYMLDNSVLRIFILVYPLIHLPYSGYRDPEQHRQWNRNRPGNICSLVGLSSSSSWSFALSLPFSFAVKCFQE